MLDYWCERQDWVRLLQKNRPHLLKKTEKIFKSRSLPVVKPSVSSDFPPNRVPEPRCRTKRPFSRPAQCKCRPRHQSSDLSGHLRARYVRHHKTHMWRDIQNLWYKDIGYIYIVLYIPFTSSYTVFPGQFIILSFSLALESSSVLIGGTIMGGRSQTMCNPRGGYGSIVMWHFTS